MFLHYTPLHMHLIGLTEHLGVRLPTSPPPSTPTSKRTEAENAAILRRKCPLLKTLNILSVRWSEAPPRTAGNLSLQEYSDIHNHAETATAAPPRFSAQCDPCAPVVHNNGHGNNHQDLSFWSIRTRMPTILERGIQRKKHRHQRNPARNMPLLVSTTSASQHNCPSVPSHEDAVYLGPADEQREHSEKRINTSKTSSACHQSRRRARPQSQAVRRTPGQVNRLQDPSPPPSRKRVKSTLGYESTCITK